MTSYAEKLVSFGVVRETHEDVKKAIDSLIGSRRTDENMSRQKELIRLLDKLDMIVARSEVMSADWYLQQVEQLRKEYERI